jgi:hypothetical protein
MLFVVQLTSFIILLLVVAAAASVVVNATGPNSADPLSYATGRQSLSLCLSMLA